VGISEEQAWVVNNSLRRYEMGTGQLINPAKSSLMFGLECSQQNRDRAAAILQVTNVAVGEKYLGLPTLQERMDSNKFKSTKERLARRYSNWAERCMSLGAKEVLIKSVA
jgi:hypothetical protein